MKKNKSDKDLSNLFNEFEKIDLTGKELDEELISLGFDPKDLVKKVRERIDKVKVRGGLHTESAPEKTEEFDPFLVAAGSKRKKKSARTKGKE